MSRDYTSRSCELTHLEAQEEAEVLADCEPVKEDVVLRADAQTVSDEVHVSQDAVPAHLCRATGGGEQTCVGWGGLLASWVAR